MWFTRVVFDCHDAVLRVFLAQCLSINEIEFSSSTQGDLYKDDIVDLADPQFCSNH